jgi:uncharacterized protein YkwD
LKGKITMSNKNNNNLSVSDLEIEIVSNSQLLIDALDKIEESFKKALKSKSCKEDLSEWVYLANNITTAVVRTLDSKIDSYKQKAHESQKLAIENYKKSGSATWHTENEAKFTVIAETLEAYANAFPTCITASGYRIDWKDLDNSAKRELSVEEFNKLRQAQGLKPISLDK